MHACSWLHIINAHHQRYHVKGSTAGYSQGLVFFELELELERELFKYNRYNLVL